MRKKKVSLNQNEVERLIYNDLDVMDAYPTYLVEDNKQDQKRLKKRLKDLLVEGEFVEGYYEDDTYALTNYGRIIGGKRVAIMALTHTNSNIYATINNNRISYSDELPNFEFKETLKRLKDLNVPLSNAYRPRKK